MTPNVERLEKLCVILESVDPKRFNLEQWASPECGTAACAVGFAALDPDFRREGLTLCVEKRRIFSWDEKTTAAQSLADVRCGVMNRFVSAQPYFNGLYGYGAAASFFGLTVDQTHHLFAPSRYEEVELRDPFAVLRRIRGLLAVSAATFKRPVLEPEVAAALGGS